MNSQVGGVSVRWAPVVVSKDEPPDLSAKEI
jgi:hypothetical protein